MSPNQPPNRLLKHSERLERTKDGADEHRNERKAFDTANGAQVRFQKRIKIRRKPRDHDVDDIMEREIVDDDGPDRNRRQNLFPWRCFVIFGHHELDGFLRNDGEIGFFEFFAEKEPQQCPKESQSAYGFEKSIRSEGRCNGR